MKLFSSGLNKFAELATRAGLRTATRELTESTAKHVDELIPSTKVARADANSEIDYARRVLNRGAHPVQPRNVPYLHRTPDLPETISLQELHRTRGIRGAQGVDLAPGSIDLQVYRRMWELSDHHGIEYSLARVRRADGTEVWRMYSGSSSAVEYKGLNAGDRIIRFGGHTHPSGSPDPSYFRLEGTNRMVGDVETLNKLWERMGYEGRLPHSRVIYGPNRVDTTKYFPNQGR